MHKKIFFEYLFINPKAQNIFGFFGNLDTNKIINKKELVFVLSNKSWGFYDLWLIKILLTKNANLIKKLPTENYSITKISKDNNIFSETEVNLKCNELFRKTKPDKLLALKFENQEVSLKDGTILNLIKKLSCYEVNNKNSRLKYSLIAEYPEIKLLKIISKGKEFSKIYNFIKSVSIPTIPLEMFTHNEYMEFCGRKSKTKIQNEIKGVEFELKLDASKFNIASFIKLYSLFKKSKFSPFVLEERYSHLLQRNLTVNYLSKQEKVVLVNYAPPFLIKKDDLFMFEKDGLNIFIRRENKEPLSTYKIKKIKKENNITKSKKVFWVNNIKTGRVYHICFDEEINKNTKLNQLEIEYVGMILNKKFVKQKENTPIYICAMKINEDIIQLGKMILNNFSMLKPTLLTKAECFFQ